MEQKRVSADRVYEAWQPVEGLWAIEEGGVRSFLIDGGDKALLIDSGFGKGDLRAFVETLTKGRITLVNTHADGDHLGCNHQFKEAYMHPAEMDRYYYGKERSCAAKALWEGEKLCFGAFCFEVVLIPGHTPGSIALLDRSRRILISGDSVQSGAVYMFGPGRNLPAFVQSMEKLQGLRDFFDIVLPSHGEGTVPAAQVEYMLNGAKELLAGRLTGEAPEREMPCKLYKADKAAFLY